MNEVLGRVLTVDGSQIMASLETDGNELSSVRVGAMVSINGPVGEVVGTISAVRLDRLLKWSSKQARSGPA